MLARLTRWLHREEAGFTLIELMIVILVILILAAILIPQFGLARERARKASCVSNQRNIETAVAMWATDNPNTNYTSNPFTTSTPSFINLTGATKYTTPTNFIEPDDTTVTDGSSYYLSGGSTPASTDPSYGHVACRVDGVQDPWVADLDGTTQPTGAPTAGSINHTRGSSASP